MSPVVTSLTNTLFPLVTTAHTEPRLAKEDNDYTVAYKSKHQNYSLHKCTHISHIYT